MPGTSAKKLLSRFVGKRGDDLRRFLRGRLLDSSEAEDVAQEAFLRVLRLDNIDFIRNPEAYLFRIAANVAYEYRVGHQGARERAVVFDEEGVPMDDQPTLVEDQAHVDTLIHEASRALAGMSPRARAAVTLYWRDGMTVREVAAALGVSTHAVKKYLATALLYCRDHLRDHEL